MAGVAYFKIYKDVAGQYRWRFVASNGKKIAESSESYHHKADCEHSISLVKTESPKAPVLQP
jgi:uncharacterized protein